MPGEKGGKTWKTGGPGEKILIAAEYSKITAQDFIMGKEPGEGQPPR